MAVGTQRYWLIGLTLSVLGVLGGRLPVTGSASHAAVAKADASASSPSTDKPAEPSPSTAAQADPCARGDLLISEYAALYGPGSANDPLQRPDFLVATVPEPEAADLSGVFDAIQEGLENAITNVHMLRDRAWLPWGVGNCAERVPGLIVYRPDHHPEANHPKVVLLVGENPTWGVRRAQLEAALLRVQRLQDRGNEPIKVLGPTFSGSAPSLAAVLGSACEPDFTFNVVSGSATAPAVEQQLRLLGSYSATTPNDTKLRKAMLDYLEARRGSPANIAILSEGATAYGASGAEPLSPTDKPRAEPVVLRFPVNMKALRKSIEAIPQSSDTPSPIAALDESAQVLVLDQVARELSRQRVRFVGVVATEGRDVVLLARELRRRLPDVRLFTLGANVELLNPRDASVLNGMLVAHSARQRPTSGDSISLRAELVAAVDAATRRLLGQHVETPAARISLVGNGALWEIGDDEPHAEPPISWYVTLGVWFLLFLFVVFCAAWPHFAPRARAGGFLGSLLGYCQRPDLRADDKLVMAALRSVVASGPLLMLLAQFGRRPPSWLACDHFLALSVGLVVVAFVGCWSPVLRARKQMGPAQPTAWVCSILALIASSLALGMGCGPAHEATLTLLCGGSVVLVGLIGFLLIGLALWCWRVRLRFLETHRFGSSRPQDPPPIAQALAETENSGTGIFEIEERLLRTIRSPWSTLPSVIVSIAVLLGLSACLIFSIRFPVGFEPRWRNYLVIGFIVLGLVPVLVNFARIIATWIALTQLLRRLGRLPVVEHLRTLPAALTRTLEQQLTISNSKLGDLAYPVELLRQIDEAVPFSSSAPRANGTPPLRTAQRASADWLRILRAQAKQQVPSPLLAHGLVRRLLSESARLQGERQLPAPVAELRDRYLAALIAIFVPRYVRHFRLYVIPVLLGSVLGVMMTSLYFLQPQRLVTSVISVWVFAMVGASFAVYVSLDRSPVISAIGKSTSGVVAFDWEFWSRLFTWGIVPLLSLFAAQYPGYAYRISQLVTSMGTALR